MSVKMLWVDDQIGGLGAYVDALKRSGFDVQTAESTEDGLKCAGEQAFNIILVDILMPPPDGIEFLRRVQPLQKGAAFGALSSYHYLDRYREQLRALSFPVEIIDKDMPNVEAPDFDERFIRPIRALAEEGVRHTIDEQNKALCREPDIDPFALPLAEFLRLPILEKDRLTLRARKLASPAIERAFAEGKIWVLLCGSRTEIRASARTPGEVVTEDQILDFARVQQRAPFQFFRPVVVEDIGMEDGQRWSDCGAGTYTSDYPTVRFEVSDEVLDVHLDTGAPFTFFSYEELTRLGVMRPTTTFAMAERGREVYQAVNLDVELLLSCPATGQKRLVRVRGQAVRDWLQAPYARFCRMSCGYQLDGQNPRLCDERRALVGRNLLIENGLVLILDGTRRITVLGGE